MEDLQQFHNHSITYECEANAVKRSFTHAHVAGSQPHYHAANDDAPYPLTDREAE